MEKNNIFRSDILDLLFEGRNKSYGAYDLRKNYERRLKLSLAVMCLACLLFFAGTLLAGNKKNKLNDIVIANIELENLKQEEQKVEPPKPLPKQDPPKVEMAQFVAPKIVEDQLVKPEEEMKEMDQLENIRIGNENREGVKDDDIVLPPTENSTGGIGPLKKSDEEDGIFRTVQIEAQFPGGINEWTKYLHRNLNKDLPAENGAPAADYAVIVSFIVDKNGVISDVRTENDPGYGTAKEAIRVILKGPKWTPAIQNGTAVVYRQKQKITFRVGEE
jgi:protein TonB